MVVDYLNGLGAVIPDKANSILIIHANAELPFPVSFQRFQPVPRRASEVSQHPRSIQHQQSSASDLLNGYEPLDSTALKEPLGVGATKGLDHLRMIYRLSINGKN